MDMTSLAGKIAWVQIYALVKSASTNTVDVPIARARQGARFMHRLIPAYGWREQDRSNALDLTEMPRERASDTPVRDDGALQRVRLITPRRHQTLPNGGGGGAYTLRVE